MHFRKFASVTRLLIKRIGELMRKYLIFLLVLFSFFTLHPVAYADFEKTKIAVLDFRLQGNDFETKDMGKIVAEWLITAFVHEGRFEVIERKLLGEVLEEQQMVEAGIVDQETASEIGKLLGVKVIISGSVAKIQDVVEVNARIVDVTSASIITAESVSSTEVTSLRNLVREMAVKIIKNFPLEGYVAHRAGKKVVIDLGKKSGVRPGMTFLSYKEGEVVKHPKTGEILYVTKIETGIIRINSVQEKIASGTIIEEIEENGIDYGDMIKSSINGTLTSLPGKVPPLTIQGPPNAVVITEDEFLEDEKPPSVVHTEKKDYSAKGLNENGTPLLYGFGKLTIKTMPENARVRILNIVPQYSDGITLPAGRYHLEVSASGYQQKVQWYVLESGEERNIDIVLKKLQETTSVVSTSKYSKYFSMIRSKDSRKVQKGAKYLYKRARTNQEVRDTSSRVLSARYNEMPNDKHFIDGMAYLCNVLGVSGQGKYISILTVISEKAENKKIRSYAAKNLRRLQ